jgi:hypothetical protein
MSCSDRIVRVTYPKDCTPEVDDSQQLLYNGPALACIDVQTNQTLNDAIKEIDALLCDAQNSLIECCNTTTTTSSSTSTPPTTTLCFGLALGSDGGGFGPTNVPITGNTTPINGRPAYTFTEPNGPVTSTLYYTGTAWVYEWPFGSPDPNWSFTIPGSTGLQYPPEFGSFSTECFLSVPNALCYLSYGECLPISDCDLAGIAEQTVPLPPIP